MTPKPEDAATDEIILPENLMPLGAVLGHGVTPLDVSMALAKVFGVQNAEVALLRLEGGLLKFIFPEHLRTTGAIPISSKAVAAHTALSKKAEIFNNFARVKHASPFRTGALTAMASLAKYVKDPTRHSNTAPRDGQTQVRRNVKLSCKTKKRGRPFWWPPPS